ncbi:MAG: DNA translocase FtsK 4TM domain-containing protein [Saprospiraceae bacterium]
MARKRGISLGIYLNDERVPKLFGALLLFLSVYLSIAFISYLFTWEEDQDSVLRFSWDLLFMGEMEMANWLGRLGAIISNMFFYWTFGVSCVAFVYLSFKYGMALVRQEPLRNLRWTLRKSILAMVVFSVVFHFFTKGLDTGFPFGGVFGQSICDWVTNFIGNLGMILLLILVLVVFITWNFNPNYSELTYEKARDNTKDWIRAKFNQGLKTVPTSSSSKGNRNDSIPVVVNDNENVAPKVIQHSKVYTSIEAIGGVERKEEPLIDGVRTNPIVEVTGQLAMNLNKSDRELAGDFFEIEESQEEQEQINDDVEEILSAPIHASPLENQGPYDPTLELSGYTYPVISLLQDYSDKRVEVDRSELEQNKDHIIATLLNYKIEIVKIRATIGPTVTLYEIVPAPGVRIARIKNLEDDIALSLSALGIRIIAPIPGKGTIGIEVPNRNKQMVSLREVLQSDKFKKSEMDLPIALGKTISNEVFVADLAKMPHLLIAGATGQGKSVGINTILMSLLYKKHPSQLKMILIDPKKVELFPYGALENHFLGYLPDQDEPIITDTSKVIMTLNSLCIEMDNRYDLLKKAAARNIKEYNEKFTNRQLNPEKGHAFLPFIVLVIDEFADLIMTAGKEVELPIGRLAQLSRAVGIHLIIATQRPSVNIITGVIKANFPARLAFKVTAKVDSRTILDSGGADQLIGRGDMLLSIGGDMVRLQCAFVDTPEVERVMNFISEQRGFSTPFLLPEYNSGDGDFGGKETFKLSELDEMFDDAARLVVENQHGSTSMIQRRMKLGYNRAGRIMDQLHSMGIVGPTDGSKPREVLIYDIVELEKFLANLAAKK